MAEARPSVILLTGASTGLGLAIAKTLIKECPSSHLVLTSRQSSLHRFESENIIEGERVWLRPLDITVRVQRLSLLEEIQEKLGGVDILINNAGFAYRAVMEHVTDGNRLLQMEVNFRAPMELVRLVLPGMRKKRAGKIINISSVGGMMAMPTMGIYSASKFALEGASESLWYEVRPWNIFVTLVQPGFIRSSSFEKTQYTDLSEKALEAEADPYHEHYAGMGPFIAKLMGRSLASPEKVAQKILKVIKAKSPPLRVQATADAVLFVWMRRLLPRRIYHRLLYASLPGVRRWGKK